MLNGELNRQEKLDVCAHLDRCEDCRSYYHDIAQICAGLREPDPEPPAEFRQKWQQQIAAAASAGPAQRPRKKKFRAAVLVPVAACFAAAVFVVSTVLISPQTFGLEGENVTGEWFAATMPAAEPEPEPVIDQGSGQKVSFVAKSEKKANLLGFEDSEYSETTTTSSAAPRLSAEGTIEPQRNEVLGAIQDAIDAEGRALPDETPVVTLQISAEEREHLRGLAPGLGVNIVSDDEDGIIFEGTPDKIGELASGHHLDLPEETDLVRLHCS